MRIVFPIVWHVPYTIQLASALAKTEEVLLLLPKNSREVNSREVYSNLIENNVKVKTFYRAKRLHYPTNPVGTVEIVKHIINFKPDIIHIQSGDFWLCFVLPILRRYPIVTTVHDPKLHLGEERLHAKFIAQVTRRYTTQTIVHGEELKKIMIKEPRAGKETIHVIPHGDYSFYKRWEGKDIQEIDNTILFFGRIWPYKGLDYLIKAQPLITKEIPEAKIVIAGKGEDFKKYEKIMMNKDAFIVYNYFISNDMIAKLFQKASIIVLPYIEATQSGVISIAYAFKKPVVATNVGSIPEVVDDGKTGYLVPPENTEKLAEAIIKLLQNKEERKKMGENAYEKMKKEMSWENIARKTIEVYKKAINDFGGTK